VRNQDWKDAETLFRQATAMAPNNAKAYVFLSGALKKQGRYAEALKASDAAVRLHPSALQHDAHHLWQRGIILVKLGLAAAAVDALEQAATADPRYGGIREDLGLAYAAAGDYRRAESAMRWALALTPDSPHVHSSLSFVLNEQGRHAEALEAAEAALQRNPKHVWAWFNKAEALEGMGRRNEAAAAYERVLALPAGPTDQPALERARANRLRLLAEQ
jgi:tetratricopeptide (TPR) repeat protein